MQECLVIQCLNIRVPQDTGRRLNVHKTSGNVLDVLCTLNLSSIAGGGGEWEEGKV